MTDRQDDPARHGDEGRTRHWVIRGVALIERLFIELGSGAVGSGGLRMDLTAGRWEDGSQRGAER
jgi:hypothetical protein